MKVNQKIPRLKATDVFGKKIDLATYEDKYDYMLLAFLRYSGCPLCNLAIHRLTLEYESLQEQKCQIIAFIQSTSDNVVKNIYDRHDPRPQFPIIPDHEMIIYKQFDVKPSIYKTMNVIGDIPAWVSAIKDHGYKHKKVDGNLFLVPAWFLVSTRTGKVIKSEKNASFYEHGTFVRIYESLIFKD